MGTEEEWIWRGGAGGQKEMGERSGVGEGRTG